MESNNIGNDLVAVLFPGIVKNDEKALQCLGGVRGISQIYSKPHKKRLGLSYQPDNPFVKKIFANSKKTAGLLLKVKVKKTTVDNEVKREVISTNVLGRVKTIYKFESMCDFQYLPVDTENPDSPKCYLEKLIPSGLDDLSYFTEPAPLLLVPANFSRFDKPTCYSYTDKKYITPGSISPERDDNIHNKRRPLRGSQLRPFFFSLTADLPTEPHESLVKQKDLKLTTNPSRIQEDYETVKKLFEERPIWSLNLIRYYTKIRLTSLKVIMPCLGVYMKTGPWRTMWVKYGYDPRKEPGARYYQTLDFRLRHAAGIRSMIIMRDEVVHYKKADRVWQVRKRNLAEDTTNTEEIVEGSVIFRPGLAPTQRHIFYQYGDVKLPEVEEILTAEPPPGNLCHEKRGWLPPQTDDKCRDFIFQYTKQTLLSSHCSELKLEQGGSSSDEESNSDDDSPNETDEA